MAWKLLQALLALTKVAAGPPYANMPISFSESATYKLNDGREMPILGLGVYVSKPGEETYNAVKWALELGYTLVDTAKIYGNEESVGKAIKDSGIAREKLWITTKLWDDSHGYDEAIAACEASLKDLGLDYLDLYLIHSPNTGKIVETWDALIELQRRGLVRSIGVSNFGYEHLNSLRHHGRPHPAVNQIEMHPLIYQERKNLLEYCEMEGILVQAYGSILFGKEDKMTSAIADVTAEHPNVSSAQVLLRWGMQMGFQIIPKSTKKHRLEENKKLFGFTLSDDQMTRLSAMKGELGAYWNPLSVAVDTGRLDRGKTKHNEL